MSSAAVIFGIPIIIFIISTPIIWGIMYYYIYVKKNKSKSLNTAFNIYTIFIVVMFIITAIITKGKIFA